MNAIRLFLIGDVWHAKSSGPHAAEIIDLFGTDTLPTSFNAGSKPETVHKAISRLNPGYVVTIEAR